MSYVLGIDLGTSRTAAAVYRDGRSDIVPLSDHAATMPSMVFVRDDTSLLVGEAARRRGHDDPSRLAREFKRRFGDSTPLVLGPSSLTAEQLTATLLRHVVDYVSQREGGPPAEVVVAHPANWGTYRRDLLRQEVAKAGLPPAQLVTEPDAAAVHYASGNRMAVGDVIAVYDLGGGTFDAAVLRRTEAGFEPVGEPKGIERLGGIDFDEAVLGHVQQAAGLDQLVLTDADLPALVRLRDDCQAAKEALSDDLEATIPVIVGSLNTRVKITRGELEQMIRPAIRDSVLCLRTAILDSGVPTSQITAVLMVGGSSRIPLAAQMVRTDLERPVVYTSNPKEAVALGAARIGGGPTPTAVVPVVPVPPTAAVAAVPEPPTVPTAPMAPVDIGATLPTTPLPPVAPVIAPPAPPRSFTPNPAPAPAKKRGLLVGVGAILAIALGAGAALAVGGNDDKKESAVTSPTGVTTPTSEDVSASSSTTDDTTAVTTPPVATTPQTAAPDVFENFARVPGIDLGGLPERMVPPDAQTSAIADGTYVGDAAFVSDDTIHVFLYQHFHGSACEVEASFDGQECLNNIYTRATTTYEVPLAANVFISIQDETTFGENFRITLDELKNLVAGGAPSVNVGDGFLFRFDFAVTVVNGEVVKMQQFFRP